MKCSTESEWKHTLFCMFLHNFNIVLCVIKCGGIQGRAATILQHILLVLVVVVVGEGDTATWMIFTTSSMSKYY